eukprot:6200841-Amphidinium_carterae.5
MSRVDSPARRSSECDTVELCGSDPPKSSGIVLASKLITSRSANDAHGHRPCHDSLLPCPTSRSANDAHSHRPCHDSLLPRRSVNDAHGHHPCHDSLLPCPTSRSANDAHGHRPCHDSLLPRPFGPSGIVLASKLRTSRSVNDAQSHRPCHDSLPPCPNSRSVNDAHGHRPCHDSLLPCPFGPGCLLPTSSTSVFPYCLGVEGKSVPPADVLHVASAPNSSHRPLGGATIPWAPTISNVLDLHAGPRPLLIHCVLSSRLGGRRPHPIHAPDGAFPLDPSSPLGVAQVDPWHLLSLERSLFLPCQRNPLLSPLGGRTSLVWRLAGAIPCLRAPLSRVDKQAWRGAHDTPHPPTLCSSRSLSDMSSLSSPRNAGNSPKAGRVPLPQARPHHFPGTPAPGRVGSHVR